MQCDGPALGQALLRDGWPVPRACPPNAMLCRPSKGWTGAVQIIVEGNKWEMCIPSGLAYGERSSRPTAKAAGFFFGCAIALWVYQVFAYQREGGGGGSNEKGTHPLFGWRHSSWPTPMGGGGGGREVSEGGEGV